MTDFPFTKLDPVATRRFLAEIAQEIAPVTYPADRTTVEFSELPFYDEIKLYAITDSTLPPPNIRYYLHKPGSLSVLNWTNEPIYSVNESAPIKLDRKTIIPYAKFFFHYVRGQQGRFIIVEKPEEVSWSADATNQEKAEVNSRLMNVTYKSIGRDNLYTLSATVVFKNALFRTDIKVAPYEMDALDPESGEMEHMTMGQMKLTNEELLLEDLHIPIDPPPGEFG